jgi:hypothetical protein
MTNYIFYNSDGEIKIVYSGQCLEQMIAINPDLSYIEGDVALVENYYIDENAEVVAKPVKPSPFHTFDYTTKDWILLGEQLEVAKTNKKTQITQQADWIHLQPIQYDGKLLDADTTAQANISGKITELKNDIELNYPSTNLFWKDANNVVHTWTDAGEYLAWLQGLFNKISMRRTELYAISWQGKEIVDSLSDINSITSYSVEDLFNV